MSVITITHVITTNSDECLYLNNRRWAKHAEWTVYLHDMIKLADGHLVKLDQIRLREEQSDKITPAGVGPIEWPETLEELIGEAPMNTETESPTVYSDGKFAETELLERMFSFHAPHGDQVTRYTLLRASAYSLAAEICKYVPPSHERQIALDRLSEAVMHANAGIARNEPKPPSQR